MPNTVMDIRHLVISGGGINGFINYAILRDSHRDKYWSIDNIRSIYGTSSGAIIATIISLKYDWETLDDYLLKRPWHHIFNMNVETVMTAFSNRGLFHYNHMVQVFSPLFKGKDISVDITLQEFYEWNGIDLHFFTTELNAGLSEDVDISHTTHPQWKVLEAVYCSSCLPILFQPLLMDSKCFVDGGVFLNYPLLPCKVQQGETDGSRIFGLKRVSLENLSLNIINEQKTLLDTTLLFLNKMMERIIQPQTFDFCPHEIEIPCSVISLTEIIHIFESEEARRELMETGSQIWREYICRKKENV